MSTTAPDPAAIPIAVPQTPAVPAPVTVVPVATLNTDSSPAPTAIDQAQTTIATAAEEIPKYLDVVKQAIALEKQLQGDAGKIHPKIKAAGIVATLVLAVEAAAKVLLGVNVDPLVYGAVTAVSPVVAGYLKSA